MCLLCLLYRRQIHHVWCGTRRRIRGINTTDAKEAVASSQIVQVQELNFYIVLCMCCIQPMHCYMHLRQTGFPLTHKIWSSALLKRCALIICGISCGIFCIRTGKRYWKSAFLQLFLIVRLEIMCKLMLWLSIFSVQANWIIYSDVTSYKKGWN